MAKEEELQVKKSVTPPEIPLGWANLNKDKASVDTIRIPADVVEISNNPNENDLTIVGTAGQKITNMGRDLYKHCSPNLTHLVLRSHLIKKMEGLRGFSKLEVLELYDNSIEYLGDLDVKSDNEEDKSNDGEIGKTLRVLDMSYNVIRDMEPVKSCFKLTELYLANNKVKVMKGLKHLTGLRKLDLGANRIRFMDGNELSGLSSLEELWLGKNKIEKIEGLEKLTKLRKLDVQSNRLTSIENLNTQKDTLEELYLSHNGIDNAGASLKSGLALSFSVLTILDLSRNRLVDCQPFSHLYTLEDLWISGNDITSFKDVSSISVLGERDGSRLECIYLEYNPVDKEFEYRKKVKELIPSLKQIDADMIISEASHRITQEGRTSVVKSLQERMGLMQEAALTRASLEADGRVSCLK